MNDDRGDETCVRVTKVGRDWKEFIKYIYMYVCVRACVCTFSKIIEIHCCESVKYLRKINNWSFLVILCLEQALIRLADRKERINSV